jgi:GNAT superfamily N-acetyltransferase
LFSAGGFDAFEMNGHDVPDLQRFFERNPEYYLLVSGQPPKPDEAREEVHGPLPDGWPYTKKWIIGVADKGDELAGVVNVVSDLLAPKVWHIGFFLIATALYGQGIARPLYDALEDWMRAQGADWLRLGVVEGNVRGERFWKARGYAEVRTRTNIPFGDRVNTISVQVKALSGGSIDDYLASVERDRPD